MKNLLIYLILTNLQPNEEGLKMIEIYFINNVITIDNNSGNVYMNCENKYSTERPGRLSLFCYILFII